MPLSAKAGFLRAEVVPSCAGAPVGQRGETAFCDCRAAYEGLTREAKERCWRLAAYHSGMVSQSRFGETTGGGIYDRSQARVERLCVWGGAATGVLSLRVAPCRLRPAASHTAPPGHPRRRCGGASGGARSEVFA